MVIVAALIAAIVEERRIDGAVIVPARRDELVIDYMSLRTGCLGIVKLSLSEAGPETALSWRLGFRTYWCVQKQ